MLLNEILQKTKLHELSTDFIVDDKKATIKWTLLNSQLLSANRQVYAIACVVNGISGSCITQNYDIEPSNYEKINDIIIKKVQRLDISKIILDATLSVEEWDIQVENRNKLRRQINAIIKDIVEDFE